MIDLLQWAVLSGIAVSCGLLGPFLVLRKMTMFANSLSHTILLGIVLAFLLTGSAFFNLSTLLIGALIASLMTAFFTGGLVKVFRLQEDASIGLVFTALFALGITLVTLYTRNVHLGIEAVMGNVDILVPSDLKMTLSLVILNLGVIALFYKEFQLTSFDGNLAKTLGIPSSIFQFLLLFLTSVTCVGAFRAVGVLLVLAFLVGPYLIARLFCHKLSHLLFWSPIVGIVISGMGVLIARILFEQFGLALSTGGIVVTLIGVVYFCAKIATKSKLGRCERKLQS